jgi:hypothetical protein
MNTDTPLPPEEPGGPNPPDGAIINYYLKSAPTGPVTLEVFDSKGRLVRRYSSADKPEAVNEENLEIPSYWIRPPQILSAEGGGHRFVWDLHYSPPAGPRRYPMTALLHDTPSEPMGIWATPGEYIVRLTVDGKRYERNLTVKMDPRIKAPPAAIVQQFELSMQCVEGMAKAAAAVSKARGIRTQLQAIADKIKDKKLSDAVAALDRELTAIVGNAGTGRRGGGGRRAEGSREQSLGQLTGEMQQLIGNLQHADAQPTKTCIDACQNAQRSLKQFLDRVERFTGKDVIELNEELRASGVAPIKP